MRCNVRSIQRSARIGALAVGDAPRGACSIAPRLSGRSRDPIARELLCRSRVPIARRLLAAGLLASAPALASAQTTTTLASVGPGGVQGDNATDYGVVSGDGRYVVFESWATNFVPGDTNGVQDVFRRDLQTGAIERVSVDSSGVQADNVSGSPSVSADGRYIAFVSDASNLAPFDFNNGSDVFLRDTLTGTTTLVSRNFSGVGTANAASWSPSISRDGRFVAFYSDATDLQLVTPDVNGWWDTYLFDSQTGQITLVSLSSQGQQGNDDSADGPAVPGSFPAVSSGGRYVVFESSASNLVANDTNGAMDVFMRDTLLGTTVRVSTSASGAQGNEYSRAPSMSADGRYVAFGSRASNLVPGDTNNVYDIFVKDMHTGALERVDVSSSGTQGSGGGLSYQPVTGTAISSDGRFVGFGSGFANLVTPDTNGSWDVFVHDRLLGTTSFVSVDSSGAQANDFSNGVSISDDGSKLVFGSLATNLVPGDTNANSDVFLRSTALSYSAICFGDESALATPCPCANTGEVGHGCENSRTTGGGLLFAEGTPSLGHDTIALRAFGLPPATVALFLQGTDPQNAGYGTVLGDGLRCLAGSQIRLGHHASSSNGSVAFGFGVASDPLVSVRGHVPSIGGVRYYQVHYRDGAAFCTSESFNWTNAIGIVWAP
jgi:Tol biopolymer transport system component